jgi:anti-sigma-K factor RskA
MTPLDRDGLAAELVLGTLEGDERREAERLAESDPGFRDSLALWRSRFAELDEIVTPQAASDELWRRIQGSLGRSARAARFPPPPLVVPSPATAFTALWRSLAFWRFAGLATAAATLALAVGLAWVAAARARTPRAGRRAPDGRQPPAAVVNAFAGGDAELIPLGAIDKPADRALQVWTLWDRSRGPVSVGLMDQARTIRLRLQDLPRTAPNQLFEISVEPPTGSPTGRPTGPVLMKGLTAPTL